MRGEFRWVGFTPMTMMHRERAICDCRTRPASGEPDERGGYRLRIHSACAYVVGGLGLIHIMLTGETYGAWVSPRALFFLGCGLAIVLLAFMNLVFVRAGHDPHVRRLCHVANAAGVALFALGAVALPLPQVFLLLALMVAQTVSGLTSPHADSR
jgi:hypothetical protein